MKKSLDNIHEETGFAGGSLQAARYLQNTLHWKHLKQKGHIQENINLTSIIETTKLIVISKDFRSGEENGGGGEFIVIFGWVDKDLH